MKFFSRYLTIPVFIIVCAASCTPSKNIAYFENLSDTLKTYNVTSAPFKNPLIKPDDLIMVNIQTLNTESNVLISAVNTPVAAVGANNATMAGNQMTSGLLVDKDGTIDLPVIGRVSIAGYTTQQARDTIKKRIDRFYTTSTVDVRFN